MSGKPYEGEDERNYEPSQKELKDKPGYPYNTVRGIPKVRYEKSKQEMERDAGPKR